MKKRILIISTIIVLFVTFLIGQQNVSAWGTIPGRYGTPVVGVYGDSIELPNPFNQFDKPVQIGDVANNGGRSVTPPINDGFDDGVAPVDPVAGHGIKHGGNNPPVKKTQPINPILDPTDPNNNNNQEQSFLVTHAQFTVIPKQGQPPYKYYWSVTGLPGMASFDDPYAQKPTLTIKVPVNKDGKVPVSFPKDLDIACKVTDANEKTYTSTFETTIKLKSNPTPPYPPGPDVNGERDKTVTVFITYKTYVKGQGWVTATAIRKMSAFDAAKLQSETKNDDSIDVQIVDDYDNGG